jgi:hypothetical protein
MRSVWSVPAVTGSVRNQLPKESSSAGWPLGSAGSGGPNGVPQEVQKGAAPLRGRPHPVQ